jgi:predicted dehydrogenase
MTPGSPFYQTEWRRSGRFPGGLLLDGGVHRVAVLRMLFGEIAHVSAVVGQTRADLPPADTLGAILRFDSGLIGTLAVTYATAAPWPPALHIIAEYGTLRVHSHSLEVISRGTTRSVTLARTGVERELAAFATAIRDGTPHRNTPEQALQDLAVVEAILQAAQVGCSIAPERVIG